MGLLKKSLQYPCPGCAAIDFQRGSFVKANHLVTVCLFLSGPFRRKDQRLWSALFGLIFLRRRELTRLHRRPNPFRRSPHAALRIFLTGWACRSPLWKFKHAPHSRLSAVINHSSFTSADRTSAASRIWSRSGSSVVYNNPEPERFCRDRADVHQYWRLHVTNENSHVLFSLPD